MDDDFIDYRGVCREIGDPPPNRSTLWRWERDGRFPARIEVAPNTIRWLRSEVRAWKASRPRRSPGRPVHQEPNIAA